MPRPKLDPEERLRRIKASKAKYYLKSTDVRHKRCMAQAIHYLVKNEDIATIKELINELTLQLKDLE